MRTTIVWVLVATTWGLGPLAHAQELAPPDPEATAARLEERMRGIRRGTSALRADVGQSYMRLAAIEMSLTERVDGARVTVVHRNEAGSLYRLVEVTYALDGQAVFHHRDEDGALGRPDPIEIHDGIVRPGDHTLSVVLRYVGEGGEVFEYLEGYRFTVRSSHSFVAPAGRHTRLSIRARSRDATVPYEHRLGIDVERVVRPWR